MKPVFKSKEELAHYFNFTVETSRDETRLAKAWLMYMTNYKADGCMGCIAEILSATKGSKKETISNAGKSDVSIKYRSASGRIVPVNCERKTNGGRIQTLETEFSAAEEIKGKYVIYSLDVCNKNTGNVRRHIPAVVIPRKLFIEKLIEFNAIKAMYHNHVCDGYGIQCSSKKWYLWLSDYPIVFDRNAVYCDEDFEGLE